MSEELNIRAATALGWKPHFGNYQIPNEVTLDVDNIMRVVSPDDLRFTTSYDWAMLGIPKIKELGDYHILRFIRCLIGPMNQGRMSVFGIIDKTPAQITQAWVEVLENES